MGGIGGGEGDGGGEGAGEGEGGAGGGEGGEGGSSSPGGGHQAGSDAVTGPYAPRKWRSCVEESGQVWPPTVSVSESTIPSARLRSGSEKSTTSPSVEPRSSL